MSELDAKVVDQAALVVGEDDTDDLEPDQPAGGDLKVALRQERGKRQAAQKQLKAMEADIAKLKPLADEYAQLLPYLPDILAKAERGGKVVQPTGQTVDDPEALQFAQIMGYEDSEGKPDIGKARKAIDFFDARTGAKVSKEVGGVKSQTAGVVARGVLERAYQAVDEEGKLYAKKEYIDKVFSELSPEAIANPDTAVAALIMARGLGGPGEDAESVEPLYIERPASGRKRAPVASNMGKAIAKIRGRSEQEWTKLQDDPVETGWDLE